jgi:hypothetical protein
LVINKKSSIFLYHNFENLWMKKPLLLFFFAVVATIESVWILKSSGFYYIDECAHFMYSRFVIDAIPLTPHTWHRPLPRWLFALPAQLGHTSTMFFALAVFLLLLYLTYRIAELKGIKHAEWVVLLTGLQPILFDLSYACMSEMPTALVLTLAYYYHLKEKHGWSLAIASLVFLCRSELYLFTGLLFLIYMRKREWKILPLAALGPFLWIGASTIISGSFITFFRDWTQFSNLGKFIPGVSVTHYFANLQTIFGYTQLVLFIIGVFFIKRAKKSTDFGLLYGTIAATLVFHTFAGAEVFHWTASIGELRYIAAVGPFFGIVSVYGFSEFFERIKSNRNQFVIAIITLSVVVFQCTMQTHPRRWAIYERIMIRMAQSIKSEYPEMMLLNNNCIVAYALDVPPTGATYFQPLNKYTLQKYSECLIFWDPFASNSIFSQTELSKEKMLQDSTIVILERDNYWKAEYLVLYRNIHGVSDWKNQHRIQNSQ